MEKHDPDVYKNPWNLFKSTNPWI